MKIKPDKQRHLFFFCLLGIAAAGIAPYLVTGAWVIAGPALVVIVAAAGLEIGQKITGLGHCTLPDFWYSCVGGVMGVGIGLLIFHHG